MKVSRWLYGFAVMLALVTVGALASTGADAGTAAVGTASPVTNPAVIKTLAAAAYVWAFRPSSSTASRSTTIW